MSAYDEELMAERIERGLAMLAPYVEGDGGSMNDPDAWMSAASAIADLLHAVDSLSDKDEDTEDVDAERVLALARLHYDEETDDDEPSSEPEPRCDVCNVSDVEAPQWCGGCGCCRAHCQKFEGCELWEYPTPLILEDEPVPAGFADAGMGNA